MIRKEYGTDIEYYVGGVKCMVYYNGHAPLDIIPECVAVADNGDIYVYGYAGDRYPTTALYRFREQKWTGTDEHGTPLRESSMLRIHCGDGPREAQCKRNGSMLPIDASGTRIHVDMTTGNWTRVS